MTTRFEDYESGLPFGPAAGAINGLNEEEMEIKILDFARSDSRKSKWGSTTWNGGVGNEGRTYYHNATTGVTSNAMGLPNIGHQRAKAFQKRVQPAVESLGKQLVPSFSPGTGEDPTVVLPDMAYGFVEAGATEIEVNLSCPNKFIEGGINVEPVLGHDLDTSFEILDTIFRTVGPNITVDVKEPPFLGEKSELIEDVAARFIELGGMFARNKIIVVLFNTIGAQSVLDERGEPALSIGEKKANLGGLSGVAFAEMARLGLAKFRRLLPEQIGITSTGGVANGSEVYHRVHELGADHTEGVTVFWENEKRRLSFGQTITQLTEEYTQALERAA